MARVLNYFELEVGKTYWHQSRYWRKIEEVTVIKVGSDYNHAEVQRKPGDTFFCDPDWNWFWSEKPTKQEEAKKYERPYSYFGEK